MRETTVALVKPYPNGTGLVFTIPKELRENQDISSHDRFFVKIDSRNRLIYEKLNEEGEPSPNVTIPASTEKVYPPSPTPSLRKTEASS